MATEFHFKSEDFEYTVTVYDWEAEEGEEEDEEDCDYEDAIDVLPERTCPVCKRLFASPGNLKQHRTVKEH